MPSQRDVYGALSGIVAYPAEPQRTHRPGGLQSAGQVWRRKQKDAAGTTAGELCPFSVWLPVSVSAWLCLHVSVTLASVELMSMYVILV